VGEDAAEADANDEITGVEEPIENDEDDDEDPAATEATTEGVDEEVNARYGQRTGQHNLRPRHKPNGKYLQAIRPQDHSCLHATLEHFGFTQYSVKKGLRMFGEAGKEAVYSEMLQLHEMDMVEPKKSNMLAREAKSKALNYLMLFLKQKRCGRIKGRGCADSQKQRIYKTKEETSAPQLWQLSRYFSHAQSTRRRDAQSRQPIYREHACKRTWMR
jgi:hypothetical protein